MLSTIQTGIRIIDNAISGFVESNDKDNTIADLQQKVLNQDEVVAENIRLRQMLNYKIVPSRVYNDLGGHYYQGFRYMVKYIYH